MHILLMIVIKNSKNYNRFLNTDYKDYTKYVIATRALPSLLDGFKVGARKLCMLLSMEE